MTSTETELWTTGAVDPDVPFCSYLWDAMAEVDAIRRHTRRVRRMNAEQARARMLKRDRGEVT